MRDTLYTVVIVLLVGAFIWRSCENERQMEAMKQGMKDVRSFTEKRDSFFGEHVNATATDSVIVERTEVPMDDIKAIVDERFDRVEQFIEAEVSSDIEKTVSYESGDTSFNDSNYIHVDSVQKYFVRVPRSAEYKDDWAYLRATAGRDSMSFDSIHVRNRIDATLGVKDRLFREDKRELKIKSYSPYSTIDYSNQIEVKRERSKVGNILLSRGAFFVYGIAGGMVLKEQF